jgi:hypothetical protein
MSHTTHSVTAPQHPTLHLTRRGRAVLSTLIAGAVITLGVLVASPGAQAGADSGVANVYTVVSGQTLWSIAEEIAPGTDPRITIDRLMRTNNLKQASIAPGDQLILPAGF